METAKKVLQAVSVALKARKRHVGWSCCQCCGGDGWHDTYTTMPHPYPCTIHASVKLMERR